jgi:hypothetical protein
VDAEPLVDDYASPSEIFDFVVDSVCPSNLERFLLEPVFDFGSIQ